MSSTTHNAQNVNEGNKTNGVFMAFEGVITELEEFRELLGRLQEHHHLYETQKTVLTRVQRQFRKCGT